MAWEMKSDIVSLGTQKCFDKFMSYLAEEEANGNPILVDTVFFKTSVAKCIMFKTIHKTIRPMVSAFLANVVVYTIAVVADNFGERFDFEKVWLRQGVSPEFLEQVQIWAREVNDRLHITAKGKMISEWAKRPECKEAMFARPFSIASNKIPEVRKIGS